MLLELVLGIDALRSVSAGPKQNLSCDFNPELVPHDPMQVLSSKSFTKVMRNYTLFR